MSAFNDIWINGKEQVSAAVRNGLSEWAPVFSGVWLSLSNEGKFVLQYEDGEYHMVLLGQLYEELTAENVLKRCVSYIKGTEGFEDPAGHYVIFLRNSVDKKTHVFTNRFGTYHAYYTVKGTISTRYFELVKTVNKQLDWQGITGYMAIGYFPDDTTFVTDVKIFNPASSYCIEDGKGVVSKKRYWNWSQSRGDSSEEEINEQIRYVLRSSLSVSTSGQRVCIPLSGGLDSRLLGGELTRNTFSYTAISGLSYGYTNNSKELAIARELAGKLNIPLHDYVMPDYLFDKLYEIEDAVELFQYVDGTRQASAVEWLREHADVVVGGHWGDVWFGSMNVGEEGELHNAFQKKIIKKGSPWLLENVCKPQLQDANEYLNDYFDSFINKYDHIDDADFIMKIYKTDQWSFRWTTASLRMYQAGAMPVLPFYDKRIAGILCAVPSSMLEGRQLQINYLKQYHEALAQTKWQEYDANLYNYKYFNNRSLGYRVVDKVKRTISTQKTITRNWEVFYLSEKGRERLESILLNSKLLHDIVSVAKVKTLLDDFYRQPTAGGGYAVSMLLTFTLFLNKLEGI